jgi:hypothetical protein
MICFLHSLPDYLPVGLSTRSNQVLLVPQPSGWTPDQILGSNRSQWLLLDRSLISFDGTQCNLVGTSFDAFRYQPSGCSRAPQVSWLVDRSGDGLVTHLLSRLVYCCDEAHV